VIYKVKKSESCSRTEKGSQEPVKRGKKGRNYDWSDRSIEKGWSSMDRSSTLPLHHYDI